MIRGFALVLPRALRQPVVLTARIFDLTVDGVSPDTQPAGIVARNRLENIFTQYHRSQNSNAQQSNSKKEVRPPKPARFWRRCRHNGLSASFI
jgi:hypothetical protein